MSDLESHSQRRHLRYAIALPSMLIGKDKAVPCRIVDFCMGGFFLEVDNSGDYLKALSAKQRVLVRFVVQEHDTFEVDAEIVHVKPSGVGVAVDHMPPLAYSALLKESRTAGKSQKSGGVSKSAREVEQAHWEKRFLEFLTANIPLLLNEFFQSLHSNIVLYNSQKLYFANQSQLDDFISDWSERRQAIIDAVSESVCSQVEFIEEKKAVKNDIVIDSTSMQLVDKSEFEDWLNISAIIRELDAQFEASLNAINWQLARIYGHSVATSSNPLRPSVLCDSFRELTLSLKMSNDLNLMVYKVFHATLRSGLPEFFHKAQDFLQGQSALARELQPAPVVVTRGSQPVFYFDNENVVPIEFSLASQGINPGATAGARPAQAVTVGAGQQVSEAVSAKLIHALQTLNQFVASSTTPSTPASAAQQPGAYYPLSDLTAAINRLQLTLLASNFDFSQPIDCKEKLSKLLANAEGAAKAFSGSNTSCIEMLDHFFDAVGSYSYVSPLLKRYLNTMQLPLLTLCLEGIDFFGDDEHPAREVVNQLMLLDSAIQRNKAVKTVRVKETVDELIGKIVKQSTANPDTFKEVAHELKWLATEVTKSTQVVIHRLIEVYEGRQKLEFARHAVQQALNERLLQARIPTVIVELLETGWQQLLTVAELTKEQRPEERAAYWGVLDDLLAWFNADDATLTMKRSDIQRTLGIIDDKLKSIFADARLHHQLISELTVTLLGVGENAARKPAMKVGYQPQPTEIVDPFPTVTDSFLLQVKQMHVGDWLSVTLQDGSSEPMKLIWIGEFLKRYVFVNREGLNKREFSTNELAAMLRTYAAKPIENLDVPLIERVTEAMLQNMHQQVVASAITDAVTDTLTREEFIKQFKHEISNLGQSGHTLCHIEVQDFRLITNVCGLAGGEQLLKKIADLARAQLPAHDFLARLGEQSFAVLFKNCTLDQAFGRATELADRVADNHFQWQDNSYAIGVSIGLVFCDQNSFDVRQLLQQADSASMLAEQSGKNRVLAFASDDEDIRRQNSIHEWIGRIDRIFAENRLFTRCQMITSIGQNRGRHTHYEILLGVRDEEGRIIPPDTFIPAVERCQRMPEIDRWVIEDVLAWINNRADEFGRIDGFAINLSGQSVNNETFLEFLVAKLAALSDLIAQKLTFEITETVASENIAFTIRFIETIKQFGCKVSLDDFGSGYSSYAYLKNLQVHYLKIDGAFVKDLAHNQADVAIVRSMNEIAHSLGLQTIAEYVENAEIQQILEEIGVDYGQGYHIHKPAPLAELTIIPAPDNPLDMLNDDRFWEI
ncbi:DUF1631 family protein [Methylomonas sp. HYX-M1]|uniref:DUF1631 family protein n=1 Tax=Methylomonas sp. HYX-M1 TaxID=3139307 RepID=UPI00345BC9D8